MYTHLHGYDLPGIMGRVGTPPMTGVLEWEDTG